MTQDIGTLLDLAVETAFAAGRSTLKYFQSGGYEIEIKQDDSPVTIADRESERMIVEAIRRRFPAHSIVGEEGGETRGSEPIKWIVDPIDGTRAFIRGVPLYSVLIAVEIEDDIAVGVVYFPALDEMYSAGRGLGARWNGRPMRVSSVDSLSGSALVATDERIIAQDPHLYERYEHLRSSVDICRTWGDAYGHMLVASGRAEMMVDPFMKFWDYAPLKAIVEEAGGAFTDLAGVPTIYSGSAISTNGILHPEVLTRLAPATAEA